jgi:DNA-binding MarR family transcriptional regulator
VGTRGNEDKHAKAAGRVLRQLRLVFHTFKGHFRRIEREVGVSGAQLWALSVVRDEPGIRLGALARALDIQQSTASNLIKPLVEGGFLTASRPDGDRRIVELRLTALARAVLRKAPQPLIGVLPHALGKMSAESLARLDEDLEALISVLDADSRDARVPLGTSDMVH